MSPFSPDFLRAIGLRQQEARRKARHNTKIVALLFLALAGTSAYRVYSGNRIVDLNRTGVHAQATIVDIDSGDADGSSYQIEYAWVAPAPGNPHAPGAAAPTKKFTGFYLLSPSLAKEMRIGQSIEIVYPQDRPQRGIPVLATRTAYDGAGWFAFFAALVFLLLLLKSLSWFAMALRFPFSLFAPRR
jgi:hypothetical protein